MCIKIYNKANQDFPMQVSFDAPVFLCHQFQCKFVCFTIEEDKRDKPNAFGIMMLATHKVVLPPPYETSSEQLLRGDHAIYNKLLELLHKKKLGWSPDAVTSVGGNFVKVLSDCLWTLDSHHEQFTLRACHLPSIFSEFKGFNDWVKKKHKKPQLSQAVLERHISILSDYLMQPWFSTSKWLNFRSSMEQLVETLHKYKSYLTVHNEKVQELHGRPIVNPAEESFSVRLIPASPKPTQKVYLKLEEVIMATEYYVPVFLNDFAPEDRYARRHWIDQLSYASHLLACVHQQLS